MSILLPGKEPIPSLPHPISARSGWPIPCERFSPEDVVPEALIRIRAQEFTSWRGGLAVRSVSDFPYNCVGMIFASRRAWIEIDHIYDILREDGYRQIASDEVMIGDIVLYKDKRAIPKHVALVVTVDRSIGESIRVVSKWGKDAEFIHFMENVPDILGLPTEFWTERS